MVDLKEKILSFLPYLFLALFFIVMLGLNLKGVGETPVSTDKTISEQENSVQEPSDSVTQEQTEPSAEKETEIIEEVQDDTDYIECYYTKNGTKFHSTPDCRYLKNSTLIIKTSYENAKDMNLTPCSGCAD